MGTAYRKNKTMKSEGVGFGEKLGERTKKMDSERKDEEWQLRSVKR